MPARTILPTRGHRVTDRLLAELRAAARADSNGATILIRPHAGHLATAQLVVYYAPQGTFRPNYLYHVDTADASRPSRRSRSSTDARAVLSRGVPCNYAAADLVCTNHTCYAAYGRHHAHRACGRRGARAADAAETQAAA